MLKHPDIRLLFVAEPGTYPFDDLTVFCSSMDHIQISEQPDLPAELGPYDTVITDRSIHRPEDTSRLLEHVQNGGGWLVLNTLRQERLPEAFGVQPGKVGPATELRVLFTERDHPLAVRLPDAVYVGGTYQPLTITADGTQTLLYADYHYRHSSVLAIRGHGLGQLACTSLQDFSSTTLKQVFTRLVRSWQGTAPDPAATLGIGILGYAPSVGRIHGLAAEQTPGLKLEAICDLSRAQLSQAGKDFPRAASYTDSISLGADPAVDLVIIATPPNSHAQLSIEMLGSGKHVLSEKPLALNSAETEAMMEAAAIRGLHLSCHQNRRWDPDYRAIRDLLESGLIGEPFYLETFVGSFHHPCGYWHSDAPVSGGTSYDWGAHYLDWIVSLMPYPVEWVRGTSHKRVWHDVTNADQERIQIRFADGREAEFLHSDIAAARKPKWYILGTSGAIQGNWRDVTTFDPDPLYYFEKTEIPATEMMPELSVFHRDSRGVMESFSPNVPERDPFAFHFNLADHLLWGEPLAAPLADSACVVAILEAATRSMQSGGSREVISRD